MGAGTLSQHIEPYDAAGASDFATRLVYSALQGDDGIPRRRCVVAAHRHVVNRDVLPVGESGGAEAGLPVATRLTAQSVLTVF